MNDSALNPVAVSLDHSLALAHWQLTDVAENTLLDDTVIRHRLQSASDRLTYAHRFTHGDRYDTGVLVISLALVQVKWNIGNREAQQFTCMFCARLARAVNRLRQGDFDEAMYDAVQVARHARRARDRSDDPTSGLVRLWEGLVQASAGAAGRSA